MAHNQRIIVGQGMVPWRCSTAQCAVPLRNPGRLRVREPNRAPAPCVDHVCTFDDRYGGWMNLPPIVIATNNGDIGGGEVMLLRIARALTSSGHRVSVVAPAAPGQVADAAEAAGLETTRLTATSRTQWIRALRKWDAAERRNARVTGRGHRLLWCNGLVPAAATAGQPARIVHLHQKPQGIAQRAAVAVARAGAMTTVVPSAYLQAEFRGSVVLPNWTDAAPPVARTRSVHGPFVIGFLGRFSTDKGIVVLAEAMRILERRDPGKYRLLMAGEPRFVDPDDYALVDSALTTLGDIIDRPGWTERNAFFGRIDILAIPSLSPESFGLGTAEAMAARVPVVVSAAGALPEVAGPDGTIVPPGNPLALADALGRLLSNPDPTGVERLYRRWQQQFSPEAGARNLEQFLAGLADRANRRAH